MEGLLAREVAEHPPNMKREEEREQEAPPKRGRGKASDWGGILFSLSSPLPPSAEHVAEADVEEALQYPTPEKQRRNRASRQN